MKRIKKIAITGAKGGTGKSTVSILLAKELLGQGKNVILCDCDVECPNDYLLLGIKLEKIVRRTYAEFPKLIKNKCKKCGVCAKNCRSNAIFAPPAEYPIFMKDLCMGCGMCQMTCPFGAIMMEKEETGKIYQNRISKFRRQSSNLKNNFYLVTGVAKAGLEETGPIVSQTKKFALNLAEKISLNQDKLADKSSENKVYLLFDTAAGTHCPVIHALMDVDFAYLVTEPTPMGAHDLRLILSLSKKLKIKSRIILNQANLGNKNLIKKIAKEYKLKIEEEIPYSKELVKDYSRGQLLSSKLKFFHKQSRSSTHKSILKVGQEK